MNGRKIIVFAILKPECVNAIAGPVSDNLQPHNPPQAIQASDATPENADVPSDDSDMLIVAQGMAPEQPAETDKSNQSSSQGHVIRMNYQDLFRQLRNQGPNTQT